MNKKRLTDAMIGRIKGAAPARRDEYSDTVVAGLSLRVTDRSHKSFCLYYYDASGRHRRFTIGPWPETTIAAAREKAQIAKNQIHAGKDPSKEQQRARRQLVGSAVELFIERHVNRNNRPRTARETVRKMNRYVLPAWQARPIAGIEKRDVAELIQKLADGGAPVMADRVLATVSKFFNWALVQPEYIDVLKANPVVRNLSPARAKKRDRTLSIDEVRRVWSAAGDMGVPFGAFTRLLLLSGQRRNEVATLRWADLDITSGIWHLPAVSAKTGRAHDVPLSTAARDLLSKLPVFSGEFVFTTTGGAKPVSGFSKAKKRLDRALPEMLAWRFHDLRRTFATHLEELDVARPVVSVLLNHAATSITDIYTRGDLADKKRDAMEKIGRHFSDGNDAPGDAGNVVYLRPP